MQKTQMIYSFVKSRLQFKTIICPIIIDDAYFRLIDRKLQKPLMTRQLLYYSNSFWNQKSWRQNNYCLMHSCKHFIKALKSIRNMKCGAQSNGNNARTFKHETNNKIYARQQFSLHHYIGQIYQGIFLILKAYCKTASIWVWDNTLNQRPISRRILKSQNAKWQVT